MRKILSFILLGLLCSIGMTKAETPDYESYDWSTADAMTAGLAGNASVTISVVTGGSDGNVSGHQYKALNSAIDGGATGLGTYLSISSDQQIDSVSIFYCPNGTNNTCLAWAGWGENVTPSSYVGSNYGVTPSIKSSKAWANAVWQTIDVSANSIYTIYISRQGKNLYNGGTKINNFGDNQTVNLLGLRVWLKSNAAKHHVTYSAGEGSGTVPTQADVAEGKTFTVASGDGMTAPSGKEFDKWNDGTNDYLPGASYTMGTSDVVLTAQWRTIVPKYAITYDLNGATGTTPTETVKIEGETFTLHNGKTGITAPEGKMFAGWNDGTTTYDGGDTYTMGNAAVTLTAQWTRLCGELIKAVHTGKTTATVTGVVGGTVDKNIAADGKFGGKGQYFGLTLASGTFKTGDILNVNLTTAGAQGSIAVYADKDGANLLYDTESMGAVGNNNFDLPAAINGKSTIYICRTTDESNKWNGYVNYISVSRSCLVTPSITTQPTAEQMVQPNASVTLSVVAAAGDGGALSYQWYYCTDANKTGASEIDGATNASYSPSTAVVGTYYYYCKVTEAGADAPKESDVAKVVVASSVYTVAYYNNPASAALGSEEVAEGDHPADYATYEVPTAVFTKFDGWYTNSNLEAQYKVDDMSAYVVNADVNFYGKWVKAYSETFDFEAYALAEGNGGGNTIEQMDNAYLAYGLVNNSDLDNNTSTNNGAYVGFKLKKTGAYIAALVPAGKMFIIKMGAVVSESNKKPQMLINSAVDGVLTGGSTSTGDNFKNYVYVNNTGMDVQYKISSQSDKTVVIKKISIVDGYARTELTANNWGTICLPYAVAAENYMGASFYEPVDADASSVTVAEVSALVAGKPYLFKATDTKLYAWWYSGDAAAAGENNGLHGNLAADPMNVPVESYILSNNQFCEVQTGANVTVAQYRAYLTWSEVQKINAAPDRGIARISLDENNATGINNVGVNDEVVKFIENGKLFILRNGVTYDATGRMVK